MKPTIGVMPLWDDEKSSIWMLPTYLDLIREQGGVPIIFPLIASAEDIAQLCDMCDGFLLTGGHDVDPALYNEAANQCCGKPSGERDAIEREVFRYALERDVPVLGICRGIQLINVLCGGTLYQDLPSEHKSHCEINHQMTPPYDKVQHSVKILPNTPLSAIVRSEWLGVNSYHHQAIKELAPKLLPMAVSDDELIEAIYMPTKRYIQAVQWHPELNYLKQESSLKIVREFIKASEEPLR